MSSVTSTAVLYCSENSIVFLKGALKIGNVITFPSLLQVGDARVSKELMWTFPVTIQS